MGLIGIDDVLRLETAVWQALVDGDQEADAELLSDDFLGVYSTGFGDRAEHVGQLDAGPTVASFEISEPRLITLSETAVLLAYRAEFRRTAAPPDAPTEAMYVSSVWCLGDGRWVNVFSQDTAESAVRPP